MDMAVEEGEEAGEEVEETEMEAEKGGTEEAPEDTVPTLTRTEEEVDHGTVLLLT